MVKNKKDAPAAAPNKKPKVGVEDAAVKNPGFTEDAPRLVGLSIIPLIEIF